MTENSHKSVQCPECNRTVYCRQFDKCGYCGAILPESFQFPQKEQERLAAIKRDLEHSEMERQQRAVEEEEKRRQNLLKTGMISAIAGSD